MLITLGLIFVLLKVTHTVDWSWVIITMPFWGPYALTFLWAHFLVDTTPRRTTRRRRTTTRRRNSASLF